MAGIVYEAVLVGIGILAVVYPHGPMAAEAPKIFERVIAGQVVSAQLSPIVQVRRNLNNDQYFLCSGLLIGRRSVLTAWHCVGRRASDLSVIGAGRSIGVRRVYLHPEADRNDEAGLVFNDLAVLRLDDPPPIKPVPILLSRAVRIGEPLTISGYGVDAFGDAGTLRQGRTRVDGVSSTHLMSRFEARESNSCNGDSGGPALVSFRDQKGVLTKGVVGVVSSGTVEDCGVGDQTFYINLQSLEAVAFLRRAAPEARFE